MCKLVSGVCPYCGVNTTKWSVSCLAYWQSYWKAIVTGRDKPAEEDCDEAQFHYELILAGRCPRLAECSSNHVYEEMKRQKVIDDRRVAQHRARQAAANMRQKRIFARNYFQKRPIPALPPRPEGAAGPLSFLEVCRRDAQKKHEEREMAQQRLRDAAAGRNREAVLNASVFSSSSEEEHTVPRNPRAFTSGYAARNNGFNNTNRAPAAASRAPVVNSPAPPAAVRAVPTRTAPFRPKPWVAPAISNENRVREAFIKAAAVQPFQPGDPTVPRSAFPHLTVAAVAVAPIALPLDIGSSDFAADVDAALSSAASFVSLSDITEDQVAAGSDAATALTSAEASCSSAFAVAANAAASPDVAVSDSSDSSEISFATAEDQPAKMPRIAAAPPNNEASSDSTLAIVTDIVASSDVQDFDAAGSSDEAPFAFVSDIAEEQVPAASDMTTALTAGEAAFEAPAAPPTGEGSSDPVATSVAGASDIVLVDAAEPSDEAPVVPGRGIAEDQFTTSSDRAGSSPTIGGAPNLPLCVAADVAAPPGVAVIDAAESPLDETLLALADDQVDTAFDIAAAHPTTEVPDSTDVAASSDQSPSDDTSATVASTLNAAADSQECVPSPGPTFAAAPTVAESSTSSDAPIASAVDLPNNDIDWDAEALASKSAADGLCFVPALATAPDAAPHVAEGCLAVASDAILAPAVTPDAHESEAGDPLLAGAPDAVESHPAEILDASDLLLSWDPTIDAETAILTNEEVGTASASAAEPSPATAPVIHAIQPAAQSPVAAAPNVAGSQAIAVDAAELPVPGAPIPRSKKSSKKFSPKAAVPAAPQPTYTAAPAKETRIVASVAPAPAPTLVRPPAPPHGLGDFRVGRYRTMLESLLSHPAAPDWQDATRVVSQVLSRVYDMDEQQERNAWNVMRDGPNPQLDSEIERLRKLLEGEEIVPRHPSHPALAYANEDDLSGDLLFEYNRIEEQRQNKLEEEDLYGDDRFLYDRSGERRSQVIYDDHEFSDNSVPPEFLGIGVEDEEDLYSDDRHLYFNRNVEVHNQEEVDEDSDNEVPPEFMGAGVEAEEEDLYSDDRHLYSNRNVVIRHREEADPDSDSEVPPEFMGMGAEEDEVLHRVDRVYDSSRDLEIRHRGWQVEADSDDAVLSRFTGATGGEDLNVDLAPSQVNQDAVFVPAYFARGRRRAEALLDVDSEVSSLGHSVDSANDSTVSPSTSPTAQASSMIVSGHFYDSLARMVAILSQPSGLGWVFGSTRDYVGPPSIPEVPCHPAAVAQGRPQVPYL